MRSTRPTSAIILWDLNVISHGQQNKRLFIEEMYNHRLPIYHGDF